jgi:hypothetical protein
MNASISNPPPAMINAVQTAPSMCGHSASAAWLASPNNVPQGDSYDGERDTNHKRPHGPKVCGIEDTDIDEDKAHGRQDERQNQKTLWSRRLTQIGCDGQRHWNQPQKSGRHDRAGKDSCTHDRQKIADIAYEAMPEGDRPISNGQTADDIPPEDEISEADGAGDNKPEDGKVKDRVLADDKGDDKVYRPCEGCDECRCTPTSMDVFMACPFSS